MSFSIDTNRGGMDRHANEMAILMMSPLIAATDCRGVGDAPISVEIRGAGIAG